MTPSQQLTLLRVIRMLCWIGGIAIMLPLIKGPHGSLSFREAMPFLAGVAVIFVPHALVCMLVPARCGACGKQVFVNVERGFASRLGHDEGPVEGFSWKCESCGEIERIDATWFDRLVAPRFLSSSGSSESHYPAE